MSKKLSVLVLILVLLCTEQVQAGVRGLAAGILLEGSFFTFRARNMNTQKNPLLVKFVVNDTDGNILSSLDLPYTFGRGGRKVRATAPLVSENTAGEIQVCGGVVSCDTPRVFETIIIANSNSTSNIGIFDESGNPVPVVPEGIGAIDIDPDEAGGSGIVGPQGPSGPQGPQGVPGPQGPTPTSFQGSNIVGPVNNSLEAQMLDNSVQTLSLTGANTNITLSAPNAGNLALTLPNTSGQLVTTTDPTPVATGSNIDIEGNSVIDASNLNYVRIVDTNNTTTDILTTITGCTTAGRRLVLVLDEAMSFQADNNKTANTLQWGRGTFSGQVLPGAAGEQFEFICDGNSWYLFGRYTL